ncbi:Hypothetical protein FKW44_016289 [Caligus rogercresseyi]|uniref:Uncharacterized protein n=1 Tax=Caligus rogercresseyi TaxID=217165 RepID=A0A7T8K115_CALRO|nr:Hypothetical protein FKW44_016289 [Caligus rogercresseyi]
MTLAFGGPSPTYKNNRYRHTNGYLKPLRLTCPSCDFSDEIRLVIGVGPHSKPGDTPYRRFNRAGGFTIGLRADGARDGTLQCPNDGTVVWTNEAGKKADGA